jgi:hypothetical protein
LETEWPLSDYSLPSDFWNKPRRAALTLRCRSPGATAIAELNKSLFGKTYDIAASDQKVIHDTNINEIEGAFQSLGNEFVCGTETIILAGMIMNFMCPRSFCARCS